MAIVKLNKEGYGQIELNQVAFRRDGRIEAQCALNSEEFPVGKTEIGSVAENGMLFAIDNVKHELKKATLALAASEVIGINYSTEHLYDERMGGSYKYFYLPNGDTSFPRLGLLAIGEKAIETAVKGVAPVYAGIASDGSGYWEISATAPTAGPVARVIEFATMPDGQTVLKLQILRV